jgi:hypothetical protein
MSGLDNYYPVCNFYAYPSKMLFGRGEPVIWPFMLLTQLFVLLKILLMPNVS